ncbi:hypothetical protein NQ315_014538 [Exocentrus adspersus]|uniref:Tyr recombinase domain-containing protein n=1 Tax=Exocentrus adspersus TaxID=1586481 RepID=A0AAV8VLH8_9CUCU|nr:hypothetical protein NQ315_014538 [Exocentrus adspersus]
MDSDMDSINCTPEDIIESAVTATMNLLPAKSKEKYLKEYDSFMEWLFNPLVNVFKIEGYYMVNNDVDISKYSKLIAYLKNKSTGYKPQKSKTFSREEISREKKFLLQAPDDHYLMRKVALIFGIAGALRREELYKMKCEDINETQNVLIITVPDTKTHVTRRFTIIGETPENNLNLIQIYKKYITQRPINVKSDHFLFAI